MKKLMFGLVLLISFSAFSQDYDFKKGFGRSLCIGTRANINTEMSNLSMGATIGVVVENIQVGFSFDGDKMTYKDDNKWTADIGYLHSINKFAISPILGVSFDRINKETNTSLYFGSMFSYIILDDLAVYIKGTTDNWVSVGFMFLIP